MKDLRELKRLLGDVFDENPQHYTEVDILGEGARGPVDHPGSIKMDAGSAAQEIKKSTKSKGHGVNRDVAMVNIAKSYDVDIHDDFERYTDPEPNKKKTDGAKSLMTEPVKESVDNFTPEDLKRMERMRDLGEIKEFARELITRSTSRSMKKEKQQYFLRQLELKNSRLAVIKMMYDLLLSGEGHGVVGSKGSTRRNSYRELYDDTTESGMGSDVAESMADTDVTVTGYGKRDPNFADDSEYKIVLRSPGGKLFRYRDVDYMKQKMPSGFHKNPDLWDDIRAGNTQWEVVRDDTELEEEELHVKNYDMNSRDGMRSMMDMMDDGDELEEAAPLIAGIGRAAAKGARAAAGAALPIVKRAGADAADAALDKGYGWAKDKVSKMREEDLQEPDFGDAEEIPDYDDEPYEFDETGEHDPEYIARFLLQFSDEDGIDLENSDVAEIQDYLNDVLHYEMDDPDGNPIDLDTVEAAMEMIHSGRMEEGALGAVGGGLVGGAIGGPAGAVGGAMLGHALTDDVNEEELDEVAPVIAAAGGAAARMAAGAAVRAGASALSGSNDVEESSTDAQDVVILEFQNEDAYIYFMDRFEDHVDYLDGDVAMPAAEQGTIEQYMTDAGYKYLEDWSFVESMDEDCGNGYDQHHRADPEDYFPSGATAPFRPGRGAGGPGDNKLATRTRTTNEQKHMDRYEHMYQRLMEEQARDRRKR